jgi:hypothetical protein
MRVGAYDRIQLRALVVTVKTFVFHRRRVVS